MGRRRYRVAAAVRKAAPVSSRRAKTTVAQQSICMDNLYCPITCTLYREDRMIPYPTGVRFRGLNRAGAEYGDDWDGWTGQTFYTFPTATELASELAFYDDRGFNALRFPISWERLQNELNGPLD